MTSRTKVKPRLSRSDAVKVNDQDHNVIRGHALFVRFLERKGLVDCVRYFPEEMTLGRLRSTSKSDLISRYGIRTAQDVERLFHLIQDTHKEDHSDSEVGSNICVNHHPAELIYLNFQPLEV